MSASLCRYCGKPIAKRTIHVYFGARAGIEPGQFWRERPERPTNKAEVQQLFNEQVVSVRWSRGYQEDKHGKHIISASLWDGESYVSEFFCNDRHAASFGYASARSGKVMPAYNDALKARAQPE